LPINPNFVKDLLKETEVTILGGGNKDEAANKIIESLAYMGVFAPEPATFDTDAFMATAGADLSSRVEGITIIGFLDRTGAFKEDETVEVGSPRRFSISKNLTQMLLDPNNGFLTED
jgi:hypothetical protein